MLDPRIVVVSLALGALALAPAALAGQEQPAPGAAPVTPPTVYSDSRVIVEWAANADHVDKVGARSDAEVAFDGDLGNRSFQLVEVEPGQTARGAIQELRTNPAVVLAERDASVATSSIPNDPKFGQLWGLQNTGLGIDGFTGAVPGVDVNAPAAWDRTVGAPATVIADIDTGYRFEHPDLENVAWTNSAEAGGTPGVDDDSDGVVDDIHGADFVGSNADTPILIADGDPTDDNLLSGGHGVHTAGTMGAEGNNGFGITGVAQDVRIMPLRVCSNSPLAGNEARCPTSSQIAAINYAAAKGARAANMSLGGTSSSQAVVNAIAAAKETLFVISAGNDSEDNDSIHHYPCDYTPQTQASPAVPGAVDNIVCVAATDQADGLASFSDWGATSVDLGAPGTEILSTFPNLRPVNEGFEGGDFATRWSATGANGGFSLTSGAPLNGNGMTNFAGGIQAANTTRQSTSSAFTATEEGRNCQAFTSRKVTLGNGDTFTYEVLLNNVVVASLTKANAASSDSSFASRFLTFPDVHVGDQIRYRVSYAAGAAPEAGVLLDDFYISCMAPVGSAKNYDFLQGTSMAAPHVTGAAGLLFSLKPAATVTEVKNALLTGVDAVPSLSGKTTSGGRLDIAKAMDSLEGDTVDHVAPSKPVLPDPVPGSGSDDNHPRIKGSAEAGATVTVFKGLTCNGGVAATGTAAELAGAGIQVTVPDNSISFFSAIATDAARNKSACSSPTSYLEDSPEGEIVAEELPPGTVEEAIGRIEQANSPASPTPPLPPGACTVPKLAGKTLAQAKAALSGAHCALGTVTKPKARHGHKLGALVVKSSTPAAGAKPASGKVNLTLGPKPKPKKHHH